MGLPQKSLAYITPEDATEAFDRTGKFEACRSMPTLETCLLVSPERRTFEAFERSEGRMRRVVEPTASLRLCGGRMTLDHAVVFTGL